ncbi:hypothetical protein FN846DRAFT_887591 [Sphaerosporella brunnea]|uniref:Uncharacterized protein n=1 Tax=Sphaerosporella brunnea TaxID=1250544 RepID=A0A5J5F5B2_9PEZI|nr:hypothetical protein FN846DRAFT_896651 [Sphaerosporella brunnea]KAA8911886.1 hypothetical protein FN846DRAFT_887591 [Sphaerosporella brunnea]
MHSEHRAQQADDNCDGSRHRGREGHPSKRVPHDWQREQLSLGHSAISALVKQEIVLTSIEQSHVAEPSPDTPDALTVMPNIGSAAPVATVDGSEETPIRAKEEAGPDSMTVMPRPTPNRPGSGVPTVLDRTTSRVPGKSDPETVNRTIREMERLDPLAAMLPTVNKNQVPTAVRADINLEVDRRRQELLRHNPPEPAVRMIDCKPWYFLLIPILLVVSGLAAWAAKRKKEHY